jgi:hypothetical protein
MKLINRLTFLAAILSTVAGAYGQDTHYNYDRGANFATDKTYQWLDIPGGAARCRITLGLASATIHCASSATFAAATLNPCGTVCNTTGGGENY